MQCKCCYSPKIRSKRIVDKVFYHCCDCGLLISKAKYDKNRFETMKKHYESVDPSETVAVAKNTFFNKMLDIIDLKSNGKKILDIGCGYGHFLDFAYKRGWEIAGVEIVEDAVKKLRQKYGNRATFCGSIEEGNFGSNLFDAITLWDVLGLVDDPSQVLKECYRMLKKGGKIGIRVRNVAFQKFAYSSYILFKKVAHKVGFKNPSAFHKYCFSSKSISSLLSNLEYKNIKITNSPLTTGDPYSHSKVNLIVNICKIVISFISNQIFWLTNEKFLTGPSLLIWAEKPLAELK